LVGPTTSPQGLSYLQSRCLPARLCGACRILGIFTYLPVITSREEKKEENNKRRKKKKKKKEEKGREKK
jgi:hypothetical protein